jgi:hypothetical protein
MVLGTQIGHDVTEHDARITAEISAEWTAVLGRAPEHPGQDLFEFGGTSFAAARLASRLSARYGVAVPLQAVIEAPSVTGLAAWLRANQVSPRGRLLPLTAGGDADPLVVFSDERGDPAPLRAALGGLRRPVFGVRSKGLAGVGEPLVSLEEMTEDWVRMFAVWSPPTTVHLAGFGVGCVFAAVAADALAAEGWAVPAVVLIDPVTPEATSFDAAIAAGIRTLAASSAGHRAGSSPTGAEPDTPESLRAALAGSGRNISDTLFDEMMVRLRIAAANTVAAGSAAPVRHERGRHLMVLSRGAVDSFDAGEFGAGEFGAGAFVRTLDADDDLAEPVEAFLADIGADSR